MSARVLEGTFSLGLERALNAPGRPMRVHRTNAGTVVKRDADGRVVGAVRGAPAGTADLVGIAGPLGLYLEVEVKADGGRVRPAQRARAAVVRRLGGVYVIVQYDDAQGLADNIGRGVVEVDNAIVRALFGHGLSAHAIALAWCVPVAAVESALREARA